MLQLMVAITTISLLSSTLPQPAHANGTSHLVVRGTITGVTVNPNLSLTFGVDRNAAIPGDPLTYSGSVTHTGITACIAGSLTAQNTGSATATIAYYFEEVDYWNANALIWTPVVGVQNTQTAFVPVVTPAVTTGITLTVVSAPTTGVTYPSQDDPILGTQIASGATAAWTGQACLTLTAAQLAAIQASPSLRLRQHAEDTPGDPTGEPWTDQPQCPNPIQAGFLNARNVVVTATPPSGSAVQITSTTVPAFSSMAPGASANYSTSYQVPVPAAKGISETDTAYFTRLSALEGWGQRALPGYHRCPR
jgi:hypothetical protein